MKMEFDSEQIHRYLSLMKSLDSKLTAYHLVFEFVQQSGRFSTQELYSKLKDAETAVKPEMDAKYDEALRTLADTTDQASALKALKFLAEWTPKGKPQ